ncbi:MAG TPA: YezD family protein [Cellvibrio sp.]|nr:YezD family protein [Cellvibrio sp.]
MGTHRPEIVNSIEDVIAEIKRQLAHIRYGSVEIQIHNGQVVQLESREKKRWDKGVSAR